ncbi:MAG: Alpha/Beta hydrolase protein [Linnemannia gamsii]|nr:MAG: Alpha/Beta hydrolase protein [Linnemannia gamsii]
MALMDLGMYLAKSTWAVSYAACSFVTLVLSWVAITGTATRNRKVNIVLCIFSNQLSELPLSVMCLDACFYTWLNLTGTFQESLLVRFFYYTNIITAVGLLYLFKRAFEVQALGQKFLDQLAKESKEWIELPGPTTARFWQQLLNPFLWSGDYTLYENIPYWTQKEQLSAQESDGWESPAEMSLDIYKPHTVEGGDDRPVLFYMHGGGWTAGSKKIIGPLLTEMISQDWVVVAVDYRLSTKAGYPTQLMDCKRALRWVKDEIRTLGGNPNNIIVAGDSAGGQMACMLALTANQPDYQPGFESVDTTVQGCLGLSAVVDLVDMNNCTNHDGRGRFIRDVAKREGSPDSAENIKFLSEHSPRFRIKNGTGVPFMIVHGDIDTLTPVQNTRAFVNEFRNTSNAHMTYLEIPGGHHCFHLISSPRSWYTVICAGQWLTHHFDNPAAVEAIQAKKPAVHEIVEWGWTV